MGVCSAAPSLGFNVRNVSNVFSLFNVFNVFNVFDIFSVFNVVNVLNVFNVFRGGQPKGAVAFFPEAGGLAQVALRWIPALGRGSSPIRTPRLPTLGADFLGWRSTALH